MLHPNRKSVRFHSKIETDPTILRSCARLLKDAKVQGPEQADQKADGQEDSRKDPKEKAFRR